MKTLARFTVVVGIAVGTTGCLGPTRMPRVTPDGAHAAWLAEASPLLGTWIDGIENEHGWVDAFRADGDVLIVAGRARDPEFNLYLDILRRRGSSWRQACAMDAGLAAQAAAESRAGETRRVLAGTTVRVVGCGSPGDGVLDVRVTFQDPRGRLEYEGAIIINRTLARARYPTRADMSGSD